MGFVVAILEKYLGLSQKNAVNKMFEIHKNGMEKIPGFEKESANKLVSQIEKVAEEYNFPLKCEVNINSKR